MDSKVLLDSIIRKMVAGRIDWTLEELQYQKNNPQEIEAALVKEQLKVPVRCDCEDIMIVPYNWNVSMLQQARKHLKMKKFLYASDAVVLAVYHNVDVQGHVCIITDDTSFIEIGIYNLGDGVFEAISTRWLSTKEQERLPMVCDAMLRDLNLTGKISQIIFARTTPDHINVHNLERVFQRAVLQVGNLTELCNIGASVRQRISQDHVKNVLLLQIISQSIGISDTDGTMLQIIPADTTIPARLTQTVYITGSELSIRQGNNTIANQNPVISTLHFDNAGISQRRQVEVTIDIDANYGCCVEVRDVITDERICSRFL